MKAAIKIVISIIIIIFLSVSLILAFWGGSLAAELGSRFLGTEVVVEQSRFIPWRLALSLRGITLPQWKVNIPQATLSLLPLRLQLTGAALAEKIIIPAENFRLLVSKAQDWDIDLFFQDIDLCLPEWKGLLPGIDISCIKNGFVAGTVAGYYSVDKGKYYLTCDLSFSELSLGDYEFLPALTAFNISSDDLAKIIESNNGTIEIDFTYGGPSDEFDQIYRYRPGRKTIALLARYVIGKNLSR